MKAKGPSNGWELQTRKILQEELPEYDVHPHMRLANVVQGRTRFIRAMSQYEIDFTVRDKETGFVICAIELDGPTHDTEDGRRRDGNKNRWLAEAGIKLIRIRHPEEAKNIRALMAMTPIGSTQEEPKYQTPYEKLQYEKLTERIFRSDIRNIRGKPYFEKEKQPFFAKIVVSAIGVFAIWFISNNILNNQQKRMMEANLQAQQRAQIQAQAVENLRRSQIARAPAPVPQQARYANILVRGKSARECARPDGTMDNYTVRCMNDHYEMVLVSNPQ